MKNYQLRCAQVQKKDDNTRVAWDWFVISEHSNPEEALNDLIKEIGKDIKNKESYYAYWVDVLEEL